MRGPYWLRVLLGAMRDKEFNDLMEFSEQLTTSERYEIYHALRRDEKIQRELFYEYLGPVFFVWWIVSHGILIGIANQLGQLS